MGVSRSIAFALDGVDPLSRFVELVYKTRCGPKYNATCTLIQLHYWVHGLLLVCFIHKRKEKRGVSVFVALQNDSELQRIKYEVYLCECSP